MIRFLRWLFGLNRPQYVHDLTGATDGYAGHWPNGVPLVHYELTEVRGKYGRE